MWTHFNHVTIDSNVRFRTEQPEIFPPATFPPEILKFSIDITMRVINNSVAETISSKQK